VAVALSAQVTTLIEEYFNSGDIGAAQLELAALDEPSFDHFFVKRALTMAMDKHDREREMICALLSALYSEVGADGQLD
jgi:MA3 domain